jgi:F0F1-type ATP synthase membrane subunit c/vacuolar-type H+-ATPase subunit K
MFPQEYYKTSSWVFDLRRSNEMGEILNSPAAGAGIVMLGAGLGIAKIGAAAVESMARQPEKAADIRGAMIVAAALIEGATFFALIVCIATAPG